jgi:serine/threonine-protein kinase PRP4
MESAMPSVAADQSSPLHNFNHPANEQTDNVSEKTVGKVDNSDDDSFDIFSTDNPTPTPTQPKNAKARNTNIMRSNIAQECDDTEGYYKASIGEVITLPKKHHSSRIDNDGESDDDRFARFRVLGIIGKGVFSTVIKVVEETNTSNSSNDNNHASAGREMAMKIIRNNEVMAKAAAKEMRILRMLCRPREKKKRKEEGKTDTNGGEEEDLDEKERRERENHNIVRLLEVDSTVASEDASLAIPPPEFRSHCVFLFEFLPYNLREVLSKFGKNVGITLTAVRSYARQLLSALGHLERHRIVHGELFPRLEFYHYLFDH